MKFEESFYGFFRFTSDITKWLVTMNKKNMQLKENTEEFCCFKVTSEMWTLV